MGTRLDVKELREYLIDLYERFLSGDKIRDEAKKTWNDYSGADKFISEEMQIAINFLEDIGWDIPLEVSHLPKPPREFALSILKSLKEEESNPPKEWFRGVYKKKE